MIELIETHDGTVAVLKHDTHLSRWIREKKTLQTDGMLETVLPMIHPGDVVYDVGACLGDWTVPIAKRVGSSGLVVAFEALPLNFACLAVNTRDCENVLCQHLAIADIQETEVICGDDNTGASHLDTSGFLVPAVRLDDYGVHDGRLDWIKLDIEGSEFRALMGAEETLERYRPKVICEINRSALRRYGLSADKIFRLMEQYRYDAVMLDPNSKESDNQYDVLFIPKSIL